jgi:hypothetical protein
VGRPGVTWTRNVRRNVTLRRQSGFFGSPVDSLALPTLTSQAGAPLRKRLTEDPGLQAVKSVLAALQTWERLPRPLVQRLGKDASALKLGPLDYIQFALHRRYRELLAGDKEQKRRSRNER